MMAIIQSFLGPCGLGLVLIMGIAGTSSFASAQTLDQIYDGGDDAFGNAGASRIAQTFTVGVAGELGVVSVELLSNDLFDLEIRRVVDEVPSNELGDILGAMEQIDPQDGDWTDVDLSDSRIAVEPGDQLAIVLTGSMSEVVTWRAGFGSTVPFPGLNALADYEHGAGFFANLHGDTSWRTAGSIDFPDRDFYFRTFVHPVPEPTTMPLLLLGSIGLAVSRRRILGCRR